MKLSRRQLIGSTLGLGGLAALSPWSIRAGLASSTPSVTDRYFVFAFFPGGWDTLLGLDPRDPDEFNDSNMAETGIQPAYNRLPGSPGLVETGLSNMVFGPYIGGLAGQASRLTVVRGMGMSSVAHATGQRHANTGRLPAGTSVRGSSIATILASLLGRSEPIPNLVAGLESFNIDHPQWASGLKTNSTEDLYTALKPGEITLEDGERDALEQFFERRRARALSSYERDLLDNRLTARELVTRELASVFDLESGSPEMSDLRDKFGIDSGATGDGGKLALMAGQALTNGVSRCVSFRATSNLDSHSGDDWQNNQGPNQQQGFDSVAALADHLAQTPFDDASSWLDHTTIVLTSEFSRSPVLNTRGGRDHYISNSCALLGGGIQGGKVVGASSDYKLGAQAVDLESGEVDDTGELIGFDHIARTLLHSVGVTDDVGDFREPPLLAVLDT